MQPFYVKYHRPGAGFPPVSFFILSRGRNTGRPSHSFKNPNCFVFSCAPQDIQRYYWIVYALYYTGRFRHYLHGSCIELIFVQDLKKLISEAACHSWIDPAIDTLQKYLTLESKLQKQMALIEKGRRVLFNKLQQPAA